MATVGTEKKLTDDAQSEFAALRDVVVQLMELRGEGAWKQMRYDLEVACSEMRVAENQLVEARWCNCRINWAHQSHAGRQAAASEHRLHTITADNHVGPGEASG